jgi:hypothetical protein
LIGLGAGPAAAADRVLDMVSADPGVVSVQFTCRMSFVSSFPLRTGDEIRIELQPLPGCAPISPGGETAPVIRDNPTGLVDIHLEPSLGGRRTLTLRFAKTVTFSIHPKQGFTGIDLEIEHKVGRGTGAQAVVQAPPPSSRAPARPLPPPEQLDKEIQDAQAALLRRDYDEAIRLYTRLLEYPEHHGRAQAQEYLGLARERKGQLAQAKLEYQEYLKRYPEGADAANVRQRLAAIVTLEGATRVARGEPDARWQIGGAVSQEYRRDTNSVTSSGVTSDGVGQSALNSSADMQVRRRGDAVDFRARVYAGYLHDMQNATSGSGASDVRLPQAYVEFDDPRSRWQTRFGRQSQSTGGAYGTFDGAYLAWRTKGGIRWSLAGGSPIETYAAKFHHTRTFGSLAVEVDSVLPNFDVTAFLFQQNAQGVLDQRQVGTELRWARGGNSVVGQVDYDFNYRALNAATLLTTFSLPGRWVLTGIADHRRTPFIGTYNALIGQPTTSLKELIDTFGINEVRLLAEDRTANTDLLTIGLQRPIGERLQWGTDVSMTRTGGTVASGGVPAVPATGTGISVSTQLLGGGWLMQGDVDSVGLAYTKRTALKTVSLFSSMRFPIGDAIRVGPRVQVLDSSGTDAATGGSSGLTVSPSLLADWRFRRGMLTFETGYERASFESSLAPGVPLDPNTPGTLSQKTRRFWFSLGYNLSF